MVSSRQVSASEYRFIRLLVFPLDTFTLPMETSKFSRQNFALKLAWCRAQLGSVVMPC